MESTGLQKPEMRGESQPIRPADRVTAEILRFAQDDTRGESRAAFENATEAKTSCRLVKRSPGGVAGAEFVFALESLPRLWDILLGAMRRHGGGAMGYAALSAHRLALGVPWFGYDFGEKQIPHEAGLENNHISYTKGCYTGQEIVERVRSRGQVNRKRAELEFAGETVPPPETVLTFDGKEVGAVTRAARTWDPNRILGMAYLRREAAAPGTRLDWSGGVAKVVEI